MLDFAVRDIHTHDPLVVRPLIQLNPRMTIVSSTQISPGKRKGITAKA